ncbi:MAG: hypothetical protein A2987_03675 [Omnitrophica bacterium RIFCSPLOWO2_01_FULL_45_10]|nr:MAG: hypothetical protein A2987_03675 [Omnitrophica bacterium RIFCSPLOWO2_01_FULL_45_10]
MKDKRIIVALLLTALFVIKIPQEGWRFIFWVLGGVSFSAMLDFFINKVIFKKVILPKSAVITGFIVSGVLDHHQDWLILILFCALAIISKHIIKFKGHHIFNPANFGLFFAALFKLPLTWKIESNIFLIIVVGLYLAYFYKKLFHVAGFLLFFITLSSVVAINAFAIISWFFIFIMLIEPKTSGYGIVRGFVFGSIAGTASFLLFRFIPTIDFFVTALFIANAFNPILEKIKR